jgi:2,3-bisphosphoglycerate-independent phosphoglycerate mutase
MSRPDHILFIFVDGLGIGKNDAEENPCFKSEHYFRCFDNEHYPKSLKNGIAIGLDANLDLPGLPQSATGQTALLTGVNASQMLGRHLNGFPNAKLREIINEKSLLKWFTDKGLDAVFLNAFRPPFFDYDPNDIIKFLSVTTVATLAAGLKFFDLDDLNAERCVYQDITSEAVREKGFDTPLFTPQQAGEIVGRRSQDYHFSLFEYFQTDKAGHSQDMQRAASILALLEDFFDAVLQNVDLQKTLVLLTSDHGNIEDLTFRGHTRNPAMTLLFGASAESASKNMHSILDVYPTIQSFFE